MAFPYEKQFRHYLTNKRVLADSTQQDICSDVERLFTHLRQFNLVYRLNPSLSNIEESDVRDYLNMLQVKREIKNSTYNKTLTHLNVYFTFLFTHKLSTSLPTISLKGLKKETEQVVPLNWADELEDCLKKSAADVVHPHGFALSFTFLYDFGNHSAGILQGLGF